MEQVGLTAPRLLTPDDDLSGFSCGLELVDDWVHKWAHRAMAANTARVYVSFAGNKVAGIYSLSTHSIARARSVAGALRRNSPDPIPCTLLGMLGVDANFKGGGVGWSLLRDAILRSSAAAETVASRALVVEPANDEAADFYRHFGFREAEEGVLFIKL